MSCALFIHQDQNFLSRIQKDAAHSPAYAQDIAPIFASSLLQGLRVISNHEVPLSGIYFNPADTSYSALRFIEIALLQRPATPLFIVSEEVNHLDPSYQALLISNHIRGAFKGHETFLEMTRSLELNPNKILKDLKRSAVNRTEHVGFTAIPIVDFIHEKTYPFNAFLETDQKALTLFATEKSEVDAEYLIRAAGISRWLYVADQDIQHIRDRVRHTQLHLMDAKGFPNLWKTAEVLFNAKMLLAELQKTGVNDHLVEQSLYMLGDVFQMVSVMSLDDENASLNYFVEQAKECDKTIASATLSILMCKSLKFDRNAVLEILGLASLLQDVALYNSPYGNLAKASPKDLSPEGQAFYLQHPLISADLVAQNSTVPDVALQVIRQHHERKDRTGFPNRVGGMQLHPMAEVLSLINSFLDVTGGTPKLINEELYRKLEQEVFPHYSERIVNAFKTILDSFLQSTTSSDDNIAA